jgi:hypothetical protein
MVDGCFLILCGIPASGKSTLAKDLIQEDWKIAGKCVHFVYINYDEFIPENLPMTDFALSANWKDRRRNIVSSLERWLLPRQSVGQENDNPGSCQSTFVSSWCPCGNDQFIRYELVAKSPHPHSPPIQQPDSITLYALYAIYDPCVI